jgi:hypothetical protein
MLLVKKKSVVNTDYTYLKLFLTWFPINETQIKVLVDSVQFDIRVLQFTVYLH